MPFSRLHNASSEPVSSATTDTQHTVQDATRVIFREREGRALDVGTSELKVGDSRADDSLQAPIQVRSAAQTRQDPVTGDWTLFAAERSNRPDQFGPQLQPDVCVDDCAFCAGNEDRTPSPVWVGRLEPEDQTGGTADWSVRVVPNLYPAVTAKLPRAPASRTKRPRHEVDAATDDLFQCEPSHGGHEVIIESPRHTRTFSDLNVAEISMVFQAYASRMEHWSSVPGIRYVSVFKNVGREAGASVQHGHSQLIASNRLPAKVDQITRRMQAYQAHTGSCLQCDVVRGELHRNERVVYQSDSLVAYCPYGSQHPYQLRITSRDHQPFFQASNENMIDDVSQLVLRTVRWLEAIRPDTAYNLLIYTCPPGFEGDESSQHWAIELFPRLTRLAGFELSSGSNINPVFPEHAAAEYRHQARQSDPRFVLV